MIVNDEAERRAIAAAVAGTVGQIRLNAGVNIAGLLIDIDSFNDVDSRQYFMCWNLTNVLGPSLAEIVPPAVVRNVVSKQAVQPRAVPYHHEPQRVDGVSVADPEPIATRPPGRIASSARDLKKFLWWLSTALILNAENWHDTQYGWFSRASRVSSISTQVCTEPESNTDSNHRKYHARRDKRRASLIDDNLDADLSVQRRSSRLWRSIIISPWRSSGGAHPLMTGPLADHFPFAWFSNGGRTESNREQNTVPHLEQCRLGSDCS